METKFSEQESLAVISEMIEQARNNFQKGAGNMMIFWGCSVSFTSLLVFILLNTLENPNQAFWAWWIMAVCGVVAHFIERRQERKLLVKTQIDTIINSVWSGYLLFCLLFLAIVFAFGILMHYVNIFVIITPVILSAVGMAEFITAKACRFRWYLFGAITMWAGALLCVVIMLLTKSIDYQFVIMAVCMLIGFVLTGILQNKKAEENV
jgi:hypothetical protein